MDVLRSTVQAIVDEQGVRGIGTAYLDGPESLKVEYVKGRSQARRLQYGEEWYNLHHPQANLHSRTPLNVIESLIDSADSLEVWHRNATGNSIGTDLRGCILNALSRVDCNKADLSVETLANDLRQFPATQIVPAYLDGLDEFQPSSLHSLVEHGVADVAGTAGPYALVELTNNEPLLLSTETAEQSFIAYESDKLRLADSFSADNVRVALGFDVDGGNGTITQKIADVGSRNGYEDAAVRLLGKLQLCRSSQIDPYLNRHLLDIEETTGEMVDQHLENARGLVSEFNMEAITSVEHDYEFGATFSVHAEEEEEVQEAASNVLNIQTPIYMMSNDGIDLQERSEGLATLLENWLRAEYDFIRKEHKLTTVKELRQEKVTSMRREASTGKTIEYVDYSIQIPEGCSKEGNRPRIIPILNDCKIRISHPFYGSRSLMVPAGAYTLAQLPERTAGAMGKGWRVSPGERRRNQLTP